MPDVHATISPPAESFEDRVTRERAEEAAAWTTMLARLPAIATAIGDGWHHTPQPCSPNEAPDYRWNRAGYLTHAPSGARLHVGLNDRYERQREAARLCVTISLPPDAAGRTRIPRDMLPYPERTDPPVSAISIAISKTNAQIGRDIARRLAAYALRLAALTDAHDNAADRAYQARAATVAALAAVGLRPTGEYLHAPRAASSVEMYGGNNAGVVGCTIGYHGDITIKLALPDAASALRVLAAMPEKGSTS